MSHHEIVIKPLLQYPEYAAVCAYWSFLEWYIQRDIPYTVVLKSYQARPQNVDELPQTYIALDGSFPVGMVTLKNDDLWSRKDLNPWLASLYVIKEYRQQGIAEQLIVYTKQKVRHMGLNMLYLFLAQSNRSVLRQYYLKRGWIFRCHATDNDGKETEIYHTCLT